MKNFYTLNTVTTDLEGFYLKLIYVLIVSPYKCISNMYFSGWHQIIVLNDYVQEKDPCLYNEKTSESNPGQGPFADRWSHPDKLYHKM